MKWGKKILALLLSLTMILATLIGCASNNQNHKINVSKTNVPKQSEEPEKSKEPIATVAPINTPSVKKITIFSLSTEVQEMMKLFKETHPDFPYEINVIASGLIDYSIEGDVIQAIDTGSENAPDLFIIPNEKVHDFTVGKYSNHVCTYEDLGLEVDKLINEAKIEPYTVKYGSNQDGKVVGLSWESSTGMFFYRRSIAKKVWGTDDPSKVEEIIGHSWDSFLQAAKQMKKKGYAMVSSVGDILEPVLDSTDHGWVVDGKLNIDLKCEESLNLAKKLHENHYDNGAVDWQDEWFEDMKDGRERKVFGYFGAWWLLPYTIQGNCDGSEMGEGTYGDWGVCKPCRPFHVSGQFLFANKFSKVKEAAGKIVRWMTLDATANGFQSYFASGEFSDVQSVPASQKVLENQSAKIRMAANQDIFPLYASQATCGNIANVSAYDGSIAYKWNAHVYAYINGSKTKKQAMKEFNDDVNATYEGEVTVDRD